MGSVNPSVGMAIFIILAALTSIVCSVIRTVYVTKRKPTVGEDLGTIAEKVSTIEQAVKEKQNSTICGQLHKELTRDLDRVEKRHSEFETKISRQVGDVHARIDKQTQAISANGARLETFMDEVRNWRNHA